MTSLPEQLSAARQAQLDTQFRLLHTFTSQAFDNASRVMALNLAVSRDSVERSSRAVRGLLAASGPRDLNLLRSHAEEQMRSMLAYSRELFGIASGIQPYLSPAPAPLATPQLPPAALPSPTQVAQSVIDVVAPVAKAVEEAVQTTVSATVAVPEAVPAPAPAPAPLVANIEPAADSVEATLNALVQEQALKDEPAVVQSVDADAPDAASLDTPTQVARQKPIARAAGKGAPKAAVVPHPMAAPMESKDSASITASVTRIDSAPPKRRK